MRERTWWRVRTAGRPGGERFLSASFDWRRGVNVMELAPAAGAYCYDRPGDAVAAAFTAAAQFGQPFTVEEFSIRPDGSFDVVD